VACIRDARRAYRLAAAHRENAPRGPLWEVHDRALRRGDASEAELHTEAEYTVYALPYRFQKYARECLLPGERLLGYVLRSPVRAGGAWGLGRQRVAHEALVVVTAQQVLLLADALPPDSTLVHWGYVARAAPLERLLDATVRPDGKLVWLEIVLATATGPGRFRVEFAAEQGASAEQMAEVLQRFAPARNERRLLRRYAVAPSHEPLAVEAFLDAETVDGLEAGLHERLADGEPVLARAIAPGGSRRAGQLLAATPRRVLVVELALDGQRPALPDELPLHVLAAVEIQNALIGGRFRLWLGGQDASAPLEVGFPYPVANPFQSLFLTLRQILAAPPGAPPRLALPGATESDRQAGPTSPAAIHKLVG